MISLKTLLIGSGILFILKTIAAFNQQNSLVEQGVIEHINIATVLNGIIFPFLVFLIVLVIFLVRNLIKSKSITHHNQQQ